MLTSYLQGFAASGGLIVAIGAQNAYVLSQGVRKAHHLAITVICILCDTIFISIGVLGLGRTIHAYPFVSQLIIWSGAGFLFLYGLRSFYSALQGGHLSVEDCGERSLLATVVTTLAVTLLNPHFYLDTVVLLGSISSKYYGQSRFLFLAGAVSASTAWFISLSFGSQLLAPIFQTRRAWKILDSIIGVTMWGIGISLLT